jgi:hypothetical protein
LLYGSANENYKSKEKENRQESGGRELGGGSNWQIYDAYEKTSNFRDLKTWTPKNWHYLEIWCIPN